MRPSNRWLPVVLVVVVLGTTGLVKLAYDLSGANKFTGPGERPSEPLVYKVRPTVAASLTVSTEGYTLQVVNSVITLHPPVGPDRTWRCDGSIGGTALINGDPWASNILIGLCGGAKQMLFVVAEPKTGKIVSFDGCEAYKGERQKSVEWPNGAFYNGVIQTYITDGSPPC